MRSILAKLAAPLVILVGLSLLGAHAADAGAGPKSRDGTVTFTLSAPSDVSVKRGAVRVVLRCGRNVAAVAVLHDPHRTAATLPLRPALAGDCQVEVTSRERPGFSDEVAITVADAEGVVERQLTYSTDGTARSREFNRGSGDVSVDVAIGALPTDEIGTPLRVMSFNIFGGGRLNELAGDEGGLENLDQLLKFIRETNPDVLFLVETYGSGELIEQALNENQPEGRTFTGVRVTRPEDNGSRGDNLWLYTWLPVEKIYPRIDADGTTSFNFGGARLGLPDGGHVHAFSTWLYHLDNARVFTNRAAMESVLGLCRTDSDADIVETDQRQRVGMAAAILDEYLNTHVTDDAPVLIGGDFNTMSHLDWTERFSSVPGHENLVLDWPVTTMFANAGFLDTYRWANPDVRRYPGRTMDMVHGFLYAPDRIDYIMARGEQVRILGSRTFTGRLPAHQGEPIDDTFPFYADHAAVVTDLMIRGAGPGPDVPPVMAEPAPEEAWPADPAGFAVPASDLTATASSEAEFNDAGQAVDGDFRTFWRSSVDPEPAPFPHQITIDMQSVRTLSTVRYQPRIRSNIGMIVRATVQVSEDGQTFHDVAQVSWDRFNRPKDIALGGARARYLRVRSELSSGGEFSSAAEITPYQTTEPEPGDPPEGESEVVVHPGSLLDDCSPAYHETGVWQTSGLPGHSGQQTRYSNEPGSTATWIPQLSEGGRYEVAIWWPEHTTTTTSARYSIESDEGDDDVTIAPRELMGQWATLGTWEFSSGTNGQVTLHVDSDEYHRADAVRFRPADDVGAP